MDGELTLIVSLVDLVRLLSPHLANPRRWCADFLASAASQLDQGCNSSYTPGPTGEPCARAFRVEYLEDEQGNRTRFVEHSGSKAALQATFAALPLLLREGALRAVGLLAAFKAGDQRLHELLDANRELTPAVVRAFLSRMDCWHSQIFTPWSRGPPSARGV